MPFAYLKQQNLLQALRFLNLSFTFYQKLRRTIKVDLKSIHIICDFINQGDNRHTAPAHSPSSDFSSLCIFNIYGPN